jgi:hypothetical protein
MTKTRILELTAREVGSQTSDKGKGKIIPVRNKVPSYEDVSYAKLHTTQ